MSSTAIDPHNHCFCTRNTGGQWMCCKCHKTADNMPKPYLGMCKHYYVENFNPKCGLGLRAGIKCHSEPNCYYYTP